MRLACGRLRLGRLHRNRTEELNLIKTCTALVATFFAVTSIPLLAQQPIPDGQSTHPAMQQAAAGPTWPQTQQPPPSSPAATSPAASPEASPAMAMSPVNGELMSKLDSKTAKAGDDVVIETKASVKTADGTEIPKGSKLTGHIIAAQPSASGEGGNSQVAVELDSVEMKGGQKMAVHSQIQSIGAASEAVATDNTSAQPAEAPRLGSTQGSANRAGNMPSQSAEPNAAPAEGGAPGTVVGHNGQIAISTTAIPGVLLANNAPGQQDPRMSKTSSILLGTKKDIELNHGTPVVIAVAATGGR